jgi:uncharacterized membrane protein
MIIAIYLQKLLTEKSPTMRSNKITHPFWQVIGIGALAGMRTSSAPAITSQIISHHHSRYLKHTPLNFMRSKTIANVLTALTVGELVVDKLPSTGNRTEPAGVVFRGLSGALAGAAIYKATGGNVVVGSLLGAASAVTSTYISFMLRKSAVKNTSIIDPIVGAIEDALVIGAGVSLIQLA